MHIKGSETKKGKQKRRFTFVYKAWKKQVFEKLNRLVTSMRLEYKTEYGNRVRRLPCIVKSPLLSLIGVDSLNNTNRNLTNVTSFFSFSSLFAYNTQGCNRTCSKTSKANPCTTFITPPVIFGIKTGERVLYFIE